MEDCKTWAFLKQCYCTEIFSLPVKVNIEPILVRIYPLQPDLFSSGKKGVTEPMHSPQEEKEKGLSWPATPSPGVLGGPAQQAREGLDRRSQHPDECRYFPPRWSRKLLWRWQRRPGVIQPLGLHQPSCNLCCSASAFSQAPRAPSSTRTEGVGAVHCVTTQFMMVILLKVFTASPQQYRLTQQGWGLFQCRLSLCKAATRILSVSAINKAPSGSGMGLVSPLGCKKGLYVPPSPLSKSDASLFTTWLSVGHLNTCTLFLISLLDYF